MKPNVNALLDVARQTYSETIEGEKWSCLFAIDNLEDIYAHANTIKNEHALDDLQIQYSAARGFFFRHPVKPDLTFPKEAIQGLSSSRLMKSTSLPFTVRKQGRTMTFSTELLVALNERQKQSVQEIVILTAR